MCVRKKTEKERERGRLCDVAVDEDVAGVGSGDDGLGHAGIRASEPQDLKQS